VFVRKIGMQQPEPPPTVAAMYVIVLLCAINDCHAYLNTLLCGAPVCIRS